MVSYFYKNIYKETTTFIACTWIGGIDLTSPSIELSTPVCRLIVSNVHDFYKGTVTYKDLDDFKHGQIPLEVLNKLIEVALQGGEEYDGDRIDWKTVFDNNNCQMTLLGYLNNSLPIQVGTFQLGRVLDSEKMQVWTEWMETTTSQFKAFKETQDALTLRNHNLEQDINKIKTVADDLVLQKTAGDLALMGKFKELLNEKKKKIRQLELKCKRNRTHGGSMEENTPISSLVSQPPPASASSSSSASASATATATTTKGRKKRNIIEQQGFSQSNSTKRQKTTLPEPSSIKTSPVVVSPVTPPASTTSNPIQQQNQRSQDLNDDDDDGNSDDFGDDPLLTTTRSRYRKFTKAETQLPKKADSDSETTDDEATSD